MFAYILKAPGLTDDDQSREFFERFSKTPGLLHAFDLQGLDDPTDAVVVAVWESREAAEEYLAHAPLRREADAAIPQITRTKYNVLRSK